MRQSLNQLQQEAARVGLYVSYYNPGDNPNFKISETATGYFQTQSKNTLFRCTKACEVSAFLFGYGCGKDSQNVLDS